MQLKLRIYLSTFVLLGLMVGIGGVGNVSKAFACDDGYGCDMGGWQSYPGCGGYCAGEQDAIYDHQNGYAYNPQGQCLPCHSDLYWNDFHEGYDHQWQTYQSQDSNQGSSINIYGNNNYVSTNQYSDQHQSPLQQLAHLACGFVNCGGSGTGPQQQQYQQSGYDEP